MGEFIPHFLISRFYLECFPKELLEAPGLDFGSILKGLGWVWGGFWEGFGRVLGEFGGFSSWTAFFDFVFWLVVLLEGFGPKTRSKIIFLLDCFFFSCSGCWCFWKSLDRKQGDLG